MSSFSRPSTGTALGFVAIMIALGGTALAATGTVVHIADGTTASRVAKVDSSGRLHVGDGSSAMTVDGTVSTRELPPKGALLRFNRGFPAGQYACETLYAPPSGSAGVLQSLNVTTYGGATAADHGDRVYVWLDKGSCTGELVEIFMHSAQGKSAVDFGAGLGIPAGYKLTANTISSSHSAHVTGYGYEAPSSAVPTPAVAATSGTDQLDALDGRGTER